GARGERRDFVSLALGGCFPLANQRRRLQVLEYSAERVVEQLRELADQRRDLAFVDGVGDGDGVGDEQPDGGSREQDADQRDQREQADADALQGAHGTSRTILPNCPDCSRRRCASAASASGYVPSIAGFSWPVKKNRAACHSSPFVPMYVPTIQTSFANTACTS